MLLPQVGGPAGKRPLAQVMGPLERCRPQKAQQTPLPRVDLCGAPGGPPSLAPPEENKKQSITT